MPAEVAIYGQPQTRQTGQGSKSSEPFNDEATQFSNLKKQLQPFNSVAANLRRVRDERSNAIPCGCAGSHRSLRNCGTRFDSSTRCSKVKSQERRDKSQKELPAN